MAKYKDISYVERYTQENCPMNRKQIMTVFLNVIGSVQIKICDILMEIKILETKMKRAWKM